MMELKDKDKLSKDNYYLFFRKNIDYQKVEICKEFMCDYTKLFTTHSSCSLQKNKESLSKLIRNHYQN